MDFSFNTFEEFMSFVKTTGKEISSWSQEKVDRFNNRVWKLQENPEFNKKYEAWEKEVIAISEKRKSALYKNEKKNSKATKKISTVSVKNRL